MKLWAKLLIASALFGLTAAKPVSAQGQLYSNIAWRYTPAGAFPASGAIITICSSSATGTPCTPTVTVYQNSTLTTPVVLVNGGLPTCTTSPQVGCLDGLGNFSFYVTPGTYTYTATGSGLTAYGPIPFGVSCVAGSTCVTTSGNNTFTGTDNFTGPFSAIFSGPSPWYDVTSPTFGAKCDGATDDTTAIQAALTAANGGGQVFSPPGKTCVIASALSMNSFTGVKVLGGFAANPFIGNTQSVWKFTGTCGAGACLSVQNAAAVNFSNIGLWFSGASTAPALNLTGSGQVGFHGTAISGPSAVSTLAPLVLDQGTNYVVFDEWTLFQWAGVFVEGPVNNGATFSDNTIFSEVVFQDPTVAAIQNASVNWVVRGSSYQMLISGFTCAPFLQNVGGFTNQQDLLVEGSTFNTSANCSNTFSLFSLPAVAGNLGGATFLSNLFIPGTAGGGTQTAITAGNGQFITALGNTFNFSNTIFSIGTGVSLNIGPNNYTTLGTFLSGTPASGSVLDNNGKTTIYGSPIATGLQCGTIAAGGACANTTTALQHCTAGIATLSGGTSTITGISPAFTSSSSFYVTTNDVTTIANASKGVPASGSSITFTGTGTDNIQFIACGG